MTINRINVRQEIKPQNGELPRNQNTSFKGAGFNPVLVVMDGIEKGGFPAEFLSQDMLGMAFPRIGAGLNRNRDKTGEYNWKFAVQEAIREFITGPSAIAIPFAVLFMARKKFGASNAVPCHFINGFGENFAEYAKKPGVNLSDAKSLKQGYYKEAFTNMLETSTDLKSLKEGSEDYIKQKGLISQKAEKYTKDLMAIDDAKPKRIWHSMGIGKENGIEFKQDLISKLNADFVAFKKQYAKPTDDVSSALLKTISEEKPIKTGFRAFIEHLSDYTADVQSSIKTNFKTSGQKIEEFVKSFSMKRVGSRLVTNLSMLGATIAFFMYIPKLYKQKDGNPGLAGLNENKAVNCDKKMEGK